MNRNLKILLGVFLTLSLIIAFIIYRYNLTFGNTVFQKSAMAGCMKKALVKNNHDESKEYCECTLNYLFSKYSDDDIRYNTSEVKRKEAVYIKNCVGDLEGIR
jgi:hypothetical protein